MLLNPHDMHRSEITVLVYLEEMIWHFIDDPGHQHYRDKIKTSTTQPVYMQSKVHIDFYLEFITEE